MQTIIKSGFYKSVITIGGWAVHVVKGPLHRHRALKLVEKCEIEAKAIIYREQIQDTTNIEHIRH